jgi:hypothetical protein
MNPKKGKRKISCFEDIRVLYGKSETSSGASWFELPFLT